jgi:hypothetical protein
LRALASERILAIETETRPAVTDRAPEHPERIIFTMSTHKRSLILLTKPEPTPPAALVEKALTAYINSGLHDFTSNLETARTMWRKYRELVEAPGYPEQLRAAFVEEAGHEPDDDCGIAGDEIFEPGWPENLRPRAIKTARVWMQKESEQHQDAEFLGELGIAG